MLCQVMRLLQHWINPVICWCPAPVSVEAEALSMTVVTLTGGFTMGDSVADITMLNRMLVTLHVTFVVEPAWSVGVLSHVLLLARGSLSHA